MDLTNFILNPATLLILIFGLVEYAKSYGLKGNPLRAASITIGFVLAFVFKIRDLMPAITPYIDIAFFGLAAGLAASGIYDFLNQRLVKK
jgi:hypothetical protein